MRSSGTVMRATLTIVIGLLAAGAIFGGPAKENANRGSTADDKGFVITAVDPASPAEKAGVKRGDILVKIDKIEPQTSSDVGYYVSRLKAGDSVDLELLRGGVSTKLTVKLGERNGSSYLGVTLEGELLGGLGRSGDNRVAPRAMQIPFGDTTVEAYVEEVVEGSPAAAAGIKAGDRIVSLDGVELRSGSSLATEIAKHKPGDKVTVEVRRQGGEAEKLELALAASTEDANKPYLGVRYREAPALMENLPGGLGRMFGMHGAVVREVASGSPAEQAGIKAGNLITKVGEDAVSASSSLADLVAKRKPGEKVDIGLYDLAGNAERTVTVTLGARPGEPDKAYLGVTTGGGMMYSTPEVTPESRSPMERSPRFNFNWQRTPSPSPATGI